MAVKGEWVQLRKGVTFLFDWLYVGEPLKYVCSLTFTGDRVSVVIQIKPTWENIIIQGKAIDKP